jgi:hypothetical protein
MEAKIVAYCGITCSSCDAYLATQSRDQAELERVAAAWREQFDPSITAASIVCDGCLTVTGRLAGYCDVCPIRACATDRGVASCALCYDYVCSTLQGQLDHAPQLRVTLDAMRKAYRDQA